MTTAKTLYWLFVGALFGIGFIGILSIGIFLLVPAIALLIFGAIRFGGKGLWAGLVGFGAAPAALLLWDVSFGWTCDSSGASGSTTASSSGGGPVYSCVSTPFGTLTAYHVMAAGFGAIAVVGLLLGLGVWLWGRRRPQRPTSEFAA